MTFPDAFNSTTEMRILETRSNGSVTILDTFDFKK